MKDSKTLYINFFDAIDPTKVNKFIQFTTEAIRHYNPTELYYLISSSGGDVDSGFVLYNYLISLQGQISIAMHNIGTIDSIANVIFLAGQKRYAAPTASFLFHGIMINLQGTFTMNALKEHMSRLEIRENRIVETMSKHTKFTQDELMGLFRQGESKDGQFALQKGVIQDIKDPQIPAGAIHLAMSFV
jgi:ATP-dependent Clp protease, protease subunit